MATRRKPKRPVGNQSDFTNLHRLKQDDGLSESHRDLARLAVASGRGGIVGKVSDYLRVQDVHKTQVEVEDKVYTFYDPKQQELRGDFYIAKTSKGEYVYLKEETFRGHTMIVGSTGSGKSMAANLLTVQLPPRGIIPIIIDPTGQQAKIILRSLPDAFYVDSTNYRRNPLLGPKRMSQREWLEVAGTHLQSALKIKAVTWRTFLNIAHSIMRSGGIVSVPSVIDRLDERNPSEKALLNRLLPLERGGTFNCQYGYDLEKMFEVPSIINVSQKDSETQRFILEDLIGFYRFSHEPRAKSKPEHALIIHEARPLIGSKITDFMISTVCEIRNYGLSIVFLMQGPHKASSEVLANIRTHLLFGLSYPADIEIFARHLNLNAKQATTIMNLQRQHLLVKRPDLPPFLAKVPNLL